MDRYTNKYSIHCWELIFHRSDIYAPYQGGVAVYHDDNGDYSTNEPTMDGTASLSYLLSSLESSDLKEAAESQSLDNQGAVVRMNSAQKIYLIFSAHEYGEGASTIERSFEEIWCKRFFFLLPAIFTGTNRMPN